MFRPIRSFLYAEAMIKRVLKKEALFCLLLFVLTFLQSEGCSRESSPLKIRVIGEFNQKGLSKDIKILTDEISNLGHCVEAVDFYRLKGKKAGDPAIEQVDIQILIQDFADSILSFGKKNYFIPNPEFCSATLKQLKKADLILARTQEVDRIFTGYNLPVFYLGFIGQDRKLEDCEKDFRKFLHVKGSSPMKGTVEVLMGWHSSFPPLTIIDHVSKYKKIPKNVLLIPHFVPDQQLKELQNSCGIHICPSKTEGFGHYLIEAMSAGAVVITVDAPPMNEFIDDPAFLIQPIKVTKQSYADIYHISPEGAREAVVNVLKMDPSQLEAVGLMNRKKYEEMQELFRARVKALLLLEP
ncbi:glycosyltransferase [Estrella lausannensis]|uniref:Glycosyltransferase n=1 Tax=Estrella lausannensis TaxID=483423 RepID=A0A0H5DQH2_9BACT|nr:glycosyltransferase [Estrella lausannensis]CRX38901.1 Glycosyltransferase [Estrella lausannensis]